MKVNILKRSAPPSTNFASLIRFVGITLSLVFAATLSACFGPPRSLTEEEDLARFKALCETPNRHFIRQTVKAEGFAEGTGESPRQIKCPDVRFLKLFLVDNKYSYYECFTQPWSEFDQGPLETFRFSLEPEGAQSCAHPSSSELGTWDRKEYKKLLLPMGTCLGVQEYSMPKSRYVFLNDVGRVKPDGIHEPGDKPYWARLVGAILYAQGKIIDSSTDTVLAEKTSYTYFPYGGGRRGRWTKDLGWGRQECSEESSARWSRPSKKWAWEVEDVIIPIPE